MRSNAIDSDHVNQLGRIHIPVKFAVKASSYLSFNMMKIYRKYLVMDGGQVDHITLA